MEDLQVSIYMNDTYSIPENPNDMPPPYWDDCGSIDQLIRGMETVIPTLDALQKEIETIDPLLEKWDKQREVLGDSFDSEGKQFNEIHADYIGYVHAIVSHSDLAILMAAITMESLINKFCVYNLHKDIVEPLERLNPCEKLVVALAIIGKPNFRSNAVYDDIKKLKTWRNSFVHGHCVELRSDNFMKNHLRKSSPSALDREAPQKVEILREMIERFIRCYEFLDKMTINRYVVEDGKEDIGRVRELLDELRTYNFSDSEYPYEIESLSP